MGVHKSLTTHDTFDVVKRGSGACVTTWLYYWHTILNLTRQCSGLQGAAAVCLSNATATTLWTTPILTHTTRPATPSYVSASTWMMYRCTWRNCSGLYDELDPCDESMAPSWYEISVSSHCFFATLSSSDAAAWSTPMSCLTKPAQLLPSAGACELTAGRERGDCRRLSFLLAILRPSVQHLSMWARAFVLQILQPICSTVSWS